MINMVINNDFPDDWENYQYFAEDEDNNYRFFDYMEEYSVFVDYLEKNDWDDLYNFAMENGYKL